MAGSFIRWFHWSVSFVSLAIASFGAVLRSPHLTKQLNGGAVLTGLQCSDAADGEYRDGFKQLAQLLGRALIETAVSTVGHARDFTECVLDVATDAFLEHEHWHAYLSELIGRGDEFVVVLLAGVTDEDQGRDLE